MSGMSLEQLRDSIAKAIADVVGHGMREKCVDHADAVLCLISRELVNVSDEDVERALDATVPGDDDGTIREFIDGDPSAVMHAALQSFAETLTVGAKVPDADNRECRFGDHYDDGYSNGYADGWNACRESILKGENK